MQIDRIILVSPEELRDLVRDAVRDELSAAANLKKDKELLNAKQLCEFLGIHISTLNSWKAQGKIPFKRLGKRIFFNKEEIMSALMDSNYVKLKKLSG